MTSCNRLRVGAVSYLNTRPLVFGLDACASELELVFDLPSRLADDLAAGSLDVALIPSVEFFQDPEYEIVSDACIACRGPVLSVKLLSRVPIHQVRTLALDEGSRTSVALTKVLLAERFSREPECSGLPIGATPDEVDSDAVLLIGDRAIHADESEYEEVWDLGEEWCRWSGLPFVFAMWTARRGIASESIRDLLQRARDQGVGRLAEIAEREAAGVRLDPATCLRYLRDNLYFYLGPNEKRGLQRFRQHASTLGLIPSIAAGTVPAR